ncbi:Fic family protein [Bdellovibrio sp. HCB337]|uniref:Fic family protein n=1 Tax=Bdellovibrio sp. HCB337 TaxID=3394358 RepID=UPI0039A6EBBE
MTSDPKQPFKLPLLPPQFKTEEIITKELVQLLIKANSSLAELNGTCRAISNPYILLNIPMLQESVASSEIEGIHTTVETALEEQVKAVGEQDPAGKEALRYREAINSGFAALDKYSLSTRTILSIHEKLMPQGGGKFKQQQNQIAKGSKIIYTPPAPPDINELMSNWEKYAHAEDEGFDPLIRVAICHYQFEAIHPFSDGNGRAGRILMVLQIVKDKLLDFPILYLSGYLNRHRDEYYRLLSSVTNDGKWIDFIKFMLQAIHEQAQVTKDVIFKMMSERNKLKKKLRKDFNSIYSPDLLDHIFNFPVTYPTFMAEKMEITYQTASKYLSTLEGAGILAKKKSGRHILYYNVKLLACLRT